MTAVDTAASRPRVLFAHDFAETYGGAERIIAEAAAAFPSAPFWAIAGRRSVAARMGVADRFHTLLPENEALLRHYRWAAPLLPLLVEATRLPEADVLVTSSYAFAHGLRTRNRAPQLCYCYSPMRFAWSMTDDYAAQMARSPLGAKAFRAFAAVMRGLDRRASRRVDRYLTESQYTADQIERCYGRSVEIVGPPIDCERFRPSDAGHDDYFLFCGRLVEAYKRPSLAVEAFRRLPQRLLVAGDGPELPRLRRIAPRNVEFLGHLDDADLVRVMQRCAAALFPSRDDFGLIPLEIMACGRPVLAYGQGGALHTVAPGVTGEFFPSQTVDCIVRAVKTFRPDAYERETIREHAKRWDRSRFRKTILEAVEDLAPG